MAENINEIKISGAGYPEALKEIPFPPKKISVWSKNGALPKAKYYLSIVGTRRHSAYGEEILRKILAGLAPYGFATVSGMAVGIDTIAAKASLENKIPTIGILGSGLSRETFYPPKNWNLAEKIVEAGGAVVSEYEHDMKATLWSFPQRNRIISGLSLVTLVIEAPEKSGALITTKFALEQNRDIFAVPQNIYNENAKGVNNLIKMGAKLVTSAEDIIEELNIETAVNFKKTSGDIVFAPDEELLMSLLAKEPMHIDSIIRESKISAAKANSLLSMLEIKGAIKNAGGGMYCKI